MTTVLPPRRSITLKADRDTLFLLAAASGMAFALAYSVHNRAAPAALQVAAAGPAVANDWAGQLSASALGVAAPPRAAEPLSSAALTVPKTAMALPAAPPGPAIRPRGCERTPCGPAQAKTAALPVAPALTAPLPPRRVAEVATRTREASLADALNPLNHLPAAVKRPFTSAGDAIAGWVRRF